MHSYASRVLLVTVSAMALLVLAGCGTAESATDTSSSAKGPIIIGAAIAKTGWMQPTDSTTMDAFMMEINKVNAAGGIDDAKIKVITEDSQTNVTVIKQVTADLISRGAQIIVATCNYDVGSPAGIEAQSHNILNVSLSARITPLGPSRNWTPGIHIGDRRLCGGLGNGSVPKGARVESSIRP